MLSVFDDISTNRSHLHATKEEVNLHLLDEQNLHQSASGAICSAKVSLVNFKTMSTNLVQFHQIMSVLSYDRASSFSCSLSRCFAAFYVFFCVSNVDTVFHEETVKTIFTEGSQIAALKCTAKLGSSTSCFLSKTKQNSLRKTPSKGRTADNLDLRNSYGFWYSYYLNKVTVNYFGMSLKVSVFMVHL